MGVTVVEEGRCRIERPGLSSSLAERSIISVLWILGRSESHIRTFATRSDWAGVVLCPGLPGERSANLKSVRLFTLLAPLFRNSALA